MLIVENLHSHLFKIFLSRSIKIYDLMLPFEVSISFIIIIVCLVRMFRSINKSQGCSSNINYVLMGGNCKMVNVYISPQGSIWGLGVRVGSLRHNDPSTVLLQEPWRKFNKFTQQNHPKQQENTPTWEQGSPNKWTISKEEGEVMRRGFGGEWIGGMVYL